MRRVPLECLSPLAGIDVEMHAIPLFQAGVILRSNEHAANANHAALYLALIGMPLLGVFATTAWGFPFAWLGVIPIPSPFGKSAYWAPIFSYLHWVGAIALGLAVLAHIGGALYHGLIRRDGVFQRMV